MDRPISELIGFGLRQRLREGYRASDLRADITAGLTVGVIALPLSMAVGIASGVPPELGLYTTCIAGFVCALLGGSRFQVTGPTAAFVAILVPVVMQFGLGGLLIAGFLAGLLQVIMGIARMGRLIVFIPYPVTTGFTSGIALVVASMQLHDAFGLPADPSAHHFADRVASAWTARGGVSLPDLCACAVTIALLLLLPRINKKLPSPLIALTAVTLGAYFVGRAFPELSVATIGSRFGGIPGKPPTPVLPWNMGGVELSFQTIQALLPSAFAIAMLGAIESLLSAVVADGATGTRTDPNAELIGAGAANMICPFFAGIPATGSIARTATSIRAGARSPIACMTHAGFVLICTILLAPAVYYVPMAALSGMVLVMVKNMVEVRQFVRVLRIAPRSDAIVMVSCFFLTVIFDMVVAIGVGVVLAALLFMKRMAALTAVKLDSDAGEKFDLPEGVRVYEIAGPFFFGAAQAAVSAFETVEGGIHTVILSMSKVPVMDATGLVALENALRKIRRAGQKVLICGLQPQPGELLERAGFHYERGKLAFAPDLDSALSMAILYDAKLRTPTR